MSVGPAEFMLGGPVERVAESWMYLYYPGLGLYMGATVERTQPYSRNIPSLIITPFKLSYALRTTSSMGQNNPLHPVGVGGPGNKN